MLLSSLAVNRQDSSLCCHNVLKIVHPRKRDTWAGKLSLMSFKCCEQDRLSYKVADSQTEVSCGKTQIVAVWLCERALRVQHRGSSVYAYAMLLRCDLVGMDVCCLILSCFLSLCLSLPLPLNVSSIFFPGLKHIMFSFHLFLFHPSSSSSNMQAQPPNRDPGKKKNCVSDDSNFRFWDQSPRVYHHDNQSEVISLSFRGRRRRKEDRHNRTNWTESGI